MIRKILQILKDHRAMQLVRNHPGDCNLISVVGHKRSGFECALNQSKIGVVGPDPADAIIKAFWKNDSTK